jgi:hypothetical protein
MLLSYLKINDFSCMKTAPVDVDYRRRKHIFLHWFSSCNNDCDKHIRLRWRNITRVICYCFTKMTKTHVWRYRKCTSLFYHVSCFFIIHKKKKTDVNDGKGRSVFVAVLFGYTRSPSDNKAIIITRFHWLFTFLFSFRF